MIAIVDYGMGNLRSVQKAFEFLGEQAVITEEPSVIAGAEKVVLPGVGAFGDAIATLRKKKLDIEVKKAADSGKPLLGICLGMQLLFEESEENGLHTGLGLLPGRIVRLPEIEKVPHIGWNSLQILKQEPLFQGIGESPYVYFVHSYYLQTDAPIVSAVCSYGAIVQAAAQKGNIFALQFHPEKSGDTGLMILKNFRGLHNADISGN